MSISSKILRKLYNRELSWLAFNRRVLQEAEDKNVPLMQRLRFVGIYSNNNDEFVKVRLAKLLRTVREQKNKKKLLPCGHTPQVLNSLVDRNINAGQQKCTEVYDHILGEMAAEGIHIINETGLDATQRRFCRDYFLSSVSSLLVPLIVTKRMQLPFLPDNGLYFAVQMESGNGRKKRFAILQIPVTDSCPRFVRLPSKDERNDVILLDDIIRLCLGDIFFMFTHDRIRAFSFKVVRDSNLYLDDDLDKSMLKKMEDGLVQRTHGRPVRLIYDREMPKELANLLAVKLKLKDGEIEPGRRYHMLRDFMRFPVIRPDLEAKRSPALAHPDLPPFSSIFRKISYKDILLSFPYQSFDHVIDFLREAAISPKIHSIHIALYRLAADSRIINALTSAAKNGKAVTAYVELLARFDEERNVSVVDILQAAGVTVIHSVPSLKTHCKLILVQSKDRTNGPKGYVYVGTGNFNEDTAKIYSDFGLLTANEDFVRDAKEMFTFLGNMHHRFICKKFLASPFSMRSEIEKRIKREIANAKDNKEAYILIKCNNITDVKMSELLYHAGKHNVKIRLMVRSSCIIKPQMPGLSENIEARSIVDKYLEHARLMIFCNGGDEEVYISSADLMTRNLDRRVEVAAPILNSRLKKELKTFFEIQWSDTAKARCLSPFDINGYIPPEDSGRVRAQETLYTYYANQLHKAKK